MSNCQYMDTLYERLSRDGGSNPLCGHKCKTFLAVGHSGAHLQAHRRSADTSEAIQ